MFLDFIGFVFFLEILAKSWVGTPALRTILDLYCVLAFEHLLISYIINKEKTLRQT